MGNASGASGVGLGSRCGLRDFKGQWQLRPLPESAYRRLIKRVRNRELHVFEVFLEFNCLKWICVMGHGDLCKFDDPSCLFNEVYEFPLNANIA